MGYVIDVLPAADIDCLETLWRELLSHHVQSAPHLAEVGPARAPEDSWRVRRAQYLRWLAESRAAALVASSSGRLAGYTVVRVVEGAGSWRWGDEVGVLETLVVASDDRGAGAGRALLQAARNRLAGWGIRVMTVSVVAGNEGALRFYRREGAVDYLQTLIMPVEGSARERLMNPSPER